MHDSWVLRGRAGQVDEGWAEGLLPGSADQRTLAAATLYLTKSRLMDTVVRCDSKPKLMKLDH